MEERNEIAGMGIQIVLYVTQARYTVGSNWESGEVWRHMGTMYGLKTLKVAIVWVPVG